MICKGDVYNELRLLEKIEVVQNISGCTKEEAVTVCQMVHIAERIGWSLPDSTTMNQLIYDAIKNGVDEMESSIADAVENAIKEGK